MAKSELESNAVPEEESCTIIWSEPDAEGCRHFVGLECESTEARDRAASDMESQELVVRVRSVRR